MILAWLTICSMTKTMVTGGITAVAYGFAGSTLAAAVYGTAALPFVIAASTGFILGSVGFYRDSVSRALLCLDRYPRLLRLHLQSNFPRQRFDLWEEPQFTSARFRQDWVLSSMLVASWMSAAPAIEVSGVRAYPCSRRGLTAIANH